LFAKKENDKIFISDDGATIEELELAGLSVDRSEKRKIEIATILNGFGVKKDTKGQLFVFCNEKTFPESKHRLIQAILSVNDLYILSEPKTEHFFFEDVEKYFDDNDIRYTPNVQFIGRSNFPHQFDFSIPKTRINPERIVKLLNTPRKDIIFSMLFSFEDTQLVRKESQGIVIINDKGAKIHDDISDALIEYRIEPIPWTNIDNFRDKFAA
jgi:hypothetical protein